VLIGVHLWPIFEPPMDADGRRSSKVAMKMPLKRQPVHPGRILKSEIDEMNLSANALALALRIPANRLTEITNGRRSISPDTALRLGRYFSTSAQLWMNLQSSYHLQEAEDLLAERIAADVQPMRKAG
jgi:addiction module HigA family antidote